MSRMSCPAGPAPGSTTRLPGPGQPPISPRCGIGSPCRAPPSAPPAASSRGCARMPPTRPRRLLCSAGRMRRLHARSTSWSRQARRNECLRGVVLAARYRCSARLRTFASSRSKPGKSGDCAPSESARSGSGFSRIGSRTRSIWTGVAWLCITTSMVLLPGGCGLILKDHSKVRPWFHFRQTESACEGEDGLLGGREIGLAAGERFDLGEWAQALGRVEGNFQLVLVERQVEALASLADCGDRAESEVLEQCEQLAELVGACRHGDLDLLAGLGWPGPARSFVGDPILPSEPADAKGLTGLGEVARRVVQVNVFVVDRLASDGPHLYQTLNQMVVIDRPILHLHFKAHGCSLNRRLPDVNVVTLAARCRCGFP